MYSWEWVKNGRERDESGPKDGQEASASEKKETEATPKIGSQTYGYIKKELKELLFSST